MALARGAGGASREGIAFDTSVAWADPLLTVDPSVGPSRIWLQCPPGVVLCGGERVRVDPTLRVKTNILLCPSVPSLAPAGGLGVALFHGDCVLGSGFTMQSQLAVQSRLASDSESLYCLGPGIKSVCLHTYCLVLLRDLLVFTLCLSSFADR